MAAGADLFELEAAALARAAAALADVAPPADGYRNALVDVVSHYERLMRETRRLIARSDRKELELNALNAQLQQLSAELDHKARHDTLTGTLNRGAVFERANHFLESAPLALIMLDIDYFKRINDEFGHPAGDAVIQELVARLQKALGKVGEIGRVGGEEFTILLPDLDLVQATRVAEAVREAIADQTFTCLPTRQVTASFGVSWTKPRSNFEQAYAEADAALYRAKQHGRNRVEASHRLHPDEAARPIHAVA